MKFRLLSFLAVTGLLTTFGCTEVPVNNDPVIGIWTDTELRAISPTARIVEKEEWIFNDAYLGRYHKYEGSEIVVLTDFGWSQTNGVYTITYPGLEGKPEDVVILTSAAEADQLEELSGEVMAQRE